MNQSSRYQTALDLVRKVMHAYRSAHTEFLATRERLEIQLESAEMHADKLNLFGLSSAITSLLNNPDDWNDHSEIIESIRSDISCDLGFDDIDEDSLDESLDALLYDQEADDESLRLSEAHLNRLQARILRSQARLRELQQSHEDPSISSLPSESGDQSDFVLDGYPLSQPATTRPSPIDITRLIDDATTTCQELAASFLPILQKLSATVNETQEKLDQLLPPPRDISLEDHLNDPESWIDGNDLHQEWIEILANHYHQWGDKVDQRAIIQILDQATAAYVLAASSLKSLQAQFDPYIHRCHAMGYFMASVCMEEWMNTPMQWTEYTRLRHDMLAALEEDRS